jgi:excisionase family DNA binding protein
MEPISEAQRERIKLLVSKREAALALGVSVRTVENYVGTKELVARRLGRRTLITVRSLEAFAQRDHASPLAVRNGDAR